ncbi:MAG: hypothetical protein EAY76_03375 [Alphaproteobacteria bacterium]|nr:MAG: hypothetical protein EAY76_03375 [Alphaproteobacteria bacterium]TAF75205.1 MAG: hypothetical protein EAZ52_07320 [Alphaproteobacteria bacterium]
MTQKSSSSNTPKVTLLDAEDNQRDTERFFDVMRESIVVLATSAPAKRVKYKTIFNCFNPDEHGNAGVNAYLTDVGSLNIPPMRTPERSGNYQSHTVEKASTALENVMNHSASIRGSIISELAPESRIITMVEDSGWELLFDHYENPEATKKQFLRNVYDSLEERFREEDHAWLFNHIKPNDPTSTFPGPNLKPIQEALTGKFNDLMDVVYEAAQQTEGMGVDNLRYMSTVNFGFAVQHEDGEQEIFVKRFSGSGMVVTPELFANIKQNLAEGLAISSDIVHMPDGQVGDPKTLEEMKDMYLIASADDVPFDYVHRNFAHWLQEEQHVGRKQDAPWQHQVHVAYVSADDFEQGIFRTDTLHHSEHVKGLIDEQIEIIGIPTRQSLRDNPYQPMLNGADIVILRGSPVNVSPEGLVYDPNLMMVDQMVVNVETDPLSMTTPIILDNRDGAFDRTLRVYRDAFQSGRLMGELPFIIAHDDASFARIVEEQRRLVGASHIVHTPPPAYPTDHKRAEFDVEALYEPQTVFIAGGHANNSKQDRAEASALGYHLAQQGLRIVTGGGQLEGSMGGIHTGFVQYHLDCAMREGLPDDLMEQVRTYRYYCTQRQQRCLDVESIIEERPELINELADRGYIPRDMFYAFSTDPLVKMESPNGIETTGARYVDTINRIPRLDALMMPRTMIFMPGGVGTDEELLHALRDKLAWHTMIPANDEAARDAADTTLIIYNRTIRDAGEEKGQIDGLLEALNIYHRDASGELCLNEAVCDAAKINVVRTEEMREHTINALMECTLNAVEEKKGWASRVREEQAMPQRRAMG